MTRLEQIGPEQTDRAFGFCAAHPAQCAYIAGWIHDGGLGGGNGAARGWLLADRRESGEIVGLAYLSATGILMPVLRSERSVDQLVSLARVNPGMIRVIVGPRRLVKALWRELAALGMEARIGRDQLMFGVERREFVPADALGLQTASATDVADVVEASAAMAREEAGDDPQARNPGLFAERIGARISRRRDFIHRVDGALSFKSNVSALSPLGGLLEGVYTAPPMRQRNIGRRGTSEITAWILERAARAVLLVNEDNDVAQHIYRGLGYRQLHESRTIFVAP